MGACEFRKCCLEVGCLSIRKKIMGKYIGNACKTGERTFKVVEVNTGATFCEFVVMVPGLHACGMGVWCCGDKWKKNH